MPGYYRDPDWTVRDVVAHVGTWLAEAQLQFERISDLRLAAEPGGYRLDHQIFAALQLDAVERLGQCLFQQGGCVSCSLLLRAKSK